MGLKLKILSGYALLLLLSAIVICLFYREEARRDTLKKERNELINVHNLTTEAYMRLLDLSSLAEVASVWTEDDFNVYRTGLEGVRQTLKSLKYRIPEQQERIDSFNLLLNEKERLLSAIMNTFDRMTEVSDIVNKKIPVIVSHVQRAPRAANSKAPEPGRMPGPEKKKSILSIFRKQRTKSAYLKQRERASATSGVEAKNSLSSVAVPLLRNLNREVAEQQKTRRERLLRQMDSLYINDQTLNRKLNTLITDFEKQASLHLASGYETLTSEQEKSFYIASGLVSAVFLLTILLYAIVHRDINKRYRYEKALKLSDQRNKDLLLSKKRMMMTIAHDLRAPLATIRGCSELLPGEKKKKRRAEYAENIRHTSDYMLGLINTLIEFYMLDTGKIQLDNSPFLPENLFKEITGNFDSPAKKKGLSLTTTFAGLDAVVEGDRLRIQQVINNLLSNALKFTRQGGIHLDAAYVNHELRFSVRDTGTGIPAKEKERIFGAFERLDNARNTSGFGLGLAICSKLVSRMEGSITVESKPGEGSTFMVVLPLSPSNESSRVEEQAPSYSDLKGTRVLVIDDDRIQLNVIRDMLHRHGMECDCCRTSRELMERLKLQTYDILLTDIQMPETDGYGILELLRSSNIEMAGNIPVLAVTAQANDESLYVSHGFSGCIHKPFSRAGLVDIIARTVGNKVKKARKPDFTLILSGEDNRKEMLGLFIAEARKDIAALSAALKKRDVDTSTAILHKNLALWEALRLDFPLPRLRELAAYASGMWTDEQITDIRKIIIAAEQLIGAAEKIREAEE